MEWIVFNEILGCFIGKLPNSLTNRIPIIMVLYKLPTGGLDLAGGIEFSFQTSLGRHGKHIFTHHLDRTFVVK